MRLVLVIHALTEGHLKLVQAVRHYVMQQQLDWQVEVQAVPCARSNGGGYLVGRIATA